MMRIPMPKPACAAAPNGRVIEYTMKRYTAMMPNSNPAGSPMASIFLQRSNRGAQSAMMNFRYESFAKKYAANQRTPITIATSDDIAAPATPYAWPVPQPKMRKGASTMLMITVAVETTIPGLKFPEPRSAALIPTRRNCNAMAGMNHSRYSPASRAVVASALMAKE